MVEVTIPSQEPQPGEAHPLGFKLKVKKVLKRLPSLKKEASPQTPETDSKNENCPSPSSPGSGGACFSPILILQRRQSRSGSRHRGSSEATSSSGTPTTVRGSFAESIDTYELNCHGAAPTPYHAIEDGNIDVIEDGNDDQFFDALDYFEDVQEGEDEVLKSEDGPFDRPSSREATEFSCIGSADGKLLPHDGTVPWASSPLLPEIRAAAQTVSTYRISDEILAFLHHSVPTEKYASIIQQFSGVRDKMLKSCRVSQTGISDGVIPPAAVSAEEARNKTSVFSLMGNDKLIHVFVFILSKHLKDTSEISLEQKVLHFISNVEEVIRRCSFGGGKIIVIIDVKKIGVKNADLAFVKALASLQRFYTPIPDKVYVVNSGFVFNSLIWNIAKPWFAEEIKKKIFFTSPGEAISTLREAGIDATNMPLVSEL